MAKLIWLGEDGPGVAGPSFTTAFGGIRFPKGEAVEVVDKDMIARARKNPFFDVVAPGRPPAPKPPAAANPIEPYIPPPEQPSGED